MRRKRIGICLSLEFLDGVVREAVTHYSHVKYRGGGCEERKFPKAANPIYVFINSQMSGVNIVYEHSSFEELSPEQNMPIVLSYRKNLD